MLTKLSARIGTPWWITLWAMSILATVVLTCWFGRDLIEDSKDRGDGQRWSGTELAPEGLDGPPRPRTTLEGRALGRAADGNPRRRAGEVSDELDSLLLKGRPMSVAELIVRMGSLTADEIPYAFDFLKEHASLGDISNDVWQSFWMRWGAVDIGSALEASTAEIQGYPDSRRVVQFLFAGLGLSDPDVAVQLLRSKEVPWNRRLAIEGLSSRWSRSDPWKATEWAQAELEGDELNTSLGAISWGVAVSQGVGESLDWWRTLSAGNGKSAAYDTLVNVFEGGLGAGVAERVDLARAGMEQGLRSSGLLNHLGAELGQSDPESGIQLLTETPSGGEGTSFHGLDTLFTSWAQADAIAAGARLAESLDQPWADMAIYGYASGIRGIDPAAASEWMSRVRSEDVRGRWERASN